MMQKKKKCVHLSLTQCYDESKIHDLYQVRFSLLLYLKVILSRVMQFSVKLTINPCESVFRHYKCRSPTREINMDYKGPEHSALPSRDLICS